MSDIEGPPSKVTRVDTTTSQNESVSSMEEGHEEWLSEEGLTDDDLNTTVSTQVRLNDQAASQDELTSTQTNSAESQEPQFELQLSTDGSPKLLINQNHTLSIEETLTNMEKDSTEDETETKNDDAANNDKDKKNTEEKDDSSNGIDDLEKFLLKKNGDIDDNTNDGEEKQKVDATEKKTSHKDDDEDDGNSTDELLHVLADDDDDDKKTRTRTRSKSKADDKIVKEPQKATLASPESSDEDVEDILKGVKVTKLRVAKNVAHKRAPPKRAEPKESESDGSTDEEAVVNKVFRSSRRLSAKSKDPKTPVQDDTVLKSSQTPANIETHILRTGDKKKLPRTYGKKKADKRSETPSKSKTPSNTASTSSKSTPTISNAPSTRSKSTAALAKAPSSSTKAPSTSSKTSAKSSAKGTPSTAKGTSVGSRLSSGGSAATSTPHKKVGKLQKDRTDQDYFNAEDMDDLDEDAFVNELDKQEAGSSKEVAATPRMEPEQMDEEMPSDDLSDDTDESFYDDVPSTDSDGMEEWFTLDLRAEKAGDYIPLLDRKAYVLLEEEKQRVAKKLETLKQSLQALNDSSKNNIAEIEQARRKITELDGMLAQN